MERLAVNDHAFIRPSPSGGALGGVSRKTRETILLFEAAGYDVVLVETIGVGQSEIAVRSMVDFFLLVLVSGAGDELQGLKRGVMELADAVLVNKADGDNVQAAELARANYEQALHYLRPATDGWSTRAFTASSSLMVCSLRAFITSGRRMVTMASSPATAARWRVLTSTSWPRSRRLRRPRPSAAAARPSSTRSPP